MPSTLVVNMVEHMAWADATAWQTVLASPKAHDDASVPMDEPFREPWTDQFEARWRSGQAAPHTLAESIAQVALHTAHHRGQVCSRLRMLGVEPPTVDFIVWLWGGRPAAAWPPQTPATGSKDASRA